MPEASTFSGAGSSRVAAGSLSGVAAQPETELLNAPASAGGNTMPAIGFGPAGASATGSAGFGSSRASV
jgi:hypothetical protein